MGMLPRAGAIRLVMAGPSASSLRPSSWRLHEQAMVVHQEPDTEDHQHEEHVHGFLRLSHVGRMPTKSPRRKEARLKKDESGKHESKHHPHNRQRDGDPKHGHHPPTHHTLASSDRRHYAGAQAAPAGWISAGL
jgi:hypothetical protein